MATKQAIEQELRRVMMKHHITVLKAKKKNPRRMPEIRVGSLAMWEHGYDDARKGLMPRLTNRGYMSGYKYGKRTKSGMKPISNPRRVLIYSDVIRIIARKGQRHICDAECKRKNHTYFHDFTPGSKIYGLPDKSLLIKG